MFNYNMQVAIKRILLLTTIVVVGVAFFLLYVFINEGTDKDETSNPATLSDFITVKSTTINSSTLPNDIRSGEKIELQIQAYLPHNPPFTPVGWSQNDFLEVAQAYWKAIWNNDLNLWQLYKVDFGTTCDNSSRQFDYAELLYYQEITRDGASLYSVREIELDPAYGYLAWGGDTIYPRPKSEGLTKIDLENITKVPAEKALVLADQHGGNDYRKKENNSCNLTVLLWPVRYKRSDWLVLYSSETSFESWIPTSSF